MPSLFILAGPNGTGKTTYYSQAILLGFIQPGLPFLNVDNICRDELGGYSIENSMRAELIIRERMKDLIDNKESFMIESNLAVQADYDWIEKMKIAGYQIKLYFLCTSDVEINIARVKKRVNEGGHDIPEAIIRQRFSNALTYLRGKLQEFEEVELIDNSEDQPINVVSILKGNIQSKITDCPEWANNLLFIIQKLADKNINH